MKITRVLANNRKRAFIVQARNRVFEFPYSMLDAKPTAANPIRRVFVDPELGGEGFTYELTDGTEDSVPLDQVLHVNRDPETLRKELLYKITCTAQDILKRSGASKRMIARRMGVRPAQLYRLLDQTFYGKTLDQMVRLLSALGQRVSISTKSAA